VGLAPIAPCDGRDFPAPGHGTERVQGPPNGRMTGARFACRVRPAWLSAARYRPRRRSDDLVPLGPGAELA
jgi:hypothetical protein